MFIFVRPQTNRREFAHSFSTLQEAQKTREVWGYDWQTLWIKLEADHKEPNVYRSE